MHTMRFLLIISIFLFFINIPVNLCAEKRAIEPLFLTGGGYLDTRKYSGSLLQMEYKHGNYIWYQLRPQVTFLMSQFASGYVGFGLGWEWYITKNMIIIPSFCPGVYWKGGGRDLGYPIEFQSALEVTYEMENQVRIGIQISHISNAHLSHRNPGLNALTLRMAIPFNIKNR